jgi:hypothetical protein
MVARGSSYHLSKKPSKKEKATFFIEELASSAATFLPLNLLID